MTTWPLTFCSFVPACLENANPSGTADVATAVSSSSPCPVVKSQSALTQDPERLEGQDTLDVCAFAACLAC